MTLWLANLVAKGTIGAAVLVFSNVTAFSVLRSSSNGSGEKNRRLPEDVVQDQLKLLKDCDIRKAYENFMSAEAKIFTLNSWRSLEAEFMSDPFQGIVGHAKATVLMTVMDKTNFDGDNERYFTTSNCLVQIVPTFGAKKEKDDNDDDDSLKVKSSNTESQRPLPIKQYWWELSEDQTTGDWMVDSVLPDFESIDVNDIVIDEQDFFSELGDEDDDDDDYF